MSKYLGYKVIRKNARELRRNLMESEKLLWEEFRNRKLSGFKFLRQHPIIYKADYKRLNYFVADFYCDSKKAVIELDGDIHKGQEEYDQFRDEEMHLMGEAESGPGAELIHLTTSNPHLTEFPSSSTAVRM